MIMEEMEVVGVQPSQMMLMIEAYLHGGEMCWEN